MSRYTVILGGSIRKGSLKSMVILDQSLNANKLVLDYCSDPEIGKEQYVLVVGQGSITLSPLKCQPDDDRVYVFEIWVSSLIPGLERLGVEYAILGRTGGGKIAYLFPLDTYQTVIEELKRGLPSSLPN